MAKVAIITRTRNRPILLKRAADSIFNQVFEDYIWIIVNDGDRGIVDNIILDYPKDKIKIIHLVNPVGMEEASNIGLCSNDSEYVVIHDDDDTWHPEFLKKTILYLDALGQSNIQQGVITYCEIINEEISGDKINIKSREEFNNWMSGVSLYGILSLNKFPPIAFLYRRKVLDDIGYYDESLPVLGDWDFNIRFLLKYDIGLIQETLAYYHHRHGLLANSVIDGNKIHKYYDNMLRNKYLRKDIQEGRIGIGFYMNVAQSLDNIITPLWYFRSTIDKILSPIRRLFGLLRR